jgi:hypothetical protein
MIPGFEKIVEDRIRMARKKGAFDDLSGSGEPLNLEDDRHIPEDLLAGMTDTRERYRVMKKLNFLIMKFNATRNSAIQFEVPQRYQESLVDRVNSAKKENRE